MGNNYSYDGNTNLLFSDTGGFRLFAPTQQDVERKIRRTRLEYTAMRRKYANNPRLRKIFDKKLLELEVIESKMIEAWTTSLDRETRDMLFRHLDWTTNDTMLLYGDDVFSHPYTLNKFRCTQDTFNESILDDDDDNDEEEEEEAPEEDNRRTGGGFDYAIRLPEAPVTPIVKENDYKIYTAL